MTDRELPRICFRLGDPGAKNTKLIQGDKMKTFVIAVFTMLLGFAPLAAIGYTSALVETDRLYEEWLLDLLAEEESGEGWKSETSFTPRAPSSSGSGGASAFPQTGQIQLAMPSLDPVADTTTRLIYSLMDTILLRFKQQLFVSTVSQWRDELLVSDFRHLFPNLASLLASIDSGSFLSTYELWKSAIDRDLLEAPLGLTGYSAALAEQDPEVTPEKLSLLRELRGLMDDVYSYHNLSNLDEFILVSTASRGEHSQLFRLIGLIAKNMLDSDGDFALLELRDRLDDPQWASLYYQTIEQDYQGLVINGDSFRVTNANLRHYLDSCSTVSDFFSALETGSDNREMDSEDWLGLYLSTCDKLLVQWSNLAHAPQYDWDEYYRLFTRQRFQIMGLARLIDERDHKPLLNSVITSSLQAAETQKLVTSSQSRFLNLISTLALTGEEDSVNYRDLMNAVLEPVGSYAYKRQARFTVALNSYPGLAGGAETLSGDVRDAKAVGGLACPVGLELNWGTGIAGLRGIFISAFDLGAVATYRFSATDADYANSPQIGWKQLVSPGIYLLLQQRDHPITLGLGMQLTPELRKVSADTTESAKNALRAGAFLSMDIPLFTLYVKHNWQTRSRRGANPAAQNN